MRLACICAAACLIASVQADERHDVVKLHYGWHPDTAARVEFTNRRIHDPAQPARDFGMHGSYRMTTKADARGLQVDFGDYRIVSDTPMADAAQQFMSRLAVLRPAYIVSEAGEIADIVGVEQMQAAIFEEIDTLLAARAEAAPPEMRAKLEQIVRSVTSHDALLGSIRQSWDRDVGQWIDAELELGHVSETEFTSPSPLLPNLELKMVSKYAYKGRTACAPGVEDGRAASDIARAEDADCVRLHMSTVPKPESLAAFMKVWSERLGVAAPDVSDIQIATEIEVVTEPDTLLPHRVRQVRTIRLPGADGKPSAQRDELHLTYNYYRPAPDGRQESSE